MGLCRFNTIVKIKKRNILDTNVFLVNLRIQVLVATLNWPLRCLVYP